MFFSFIVVARTGRPNDYNLEFISALRLVAEVYVLCFWFSNVITEMTEIVAIMIRTRLYLLHKKNVPFSPDADDEPPEETSSTEFDNSTEWKDLDLLARVLARVKHLLTRFLGDYFSDSFKWFDQGGLISLFITIILRVFCSPLQWLFMPITFVLNCMRIFKLFIVYYNFGTYTRILVSVTFYEIPPFLMFFCWTLFVFSGAYFVSLRLPTVWQCPNDTDCQLDMIINSTYSQGHDNTIWYTGLLGLRMLLEQSPVYEDNYIVRLNFLSAIIFLLFLFITSVVYLNLLIAQLTDRFVILFIYDIVYPYLCYLISI